MRDFLDNLLPDIQTEFSDNMEMLQYYGGLLLNIVAIIVMISVVLSCSRFFIRFLHHKVRTSYLGDMIWHEVIYEGVVGDSEVVKADGQVKNMQNLMFNTSAPILGMFHFRRMMASFMIRKSDDDDTTHMYVGIDRKNYSKGSLNSWAQGSNCSVEEIDFDEIGFVPNAPTTAIVKGYIPQKFTDSPTNSTVGGVMSRMQDLLPEGHAGTALITYEPMRRDEQRVLISHITDDNIKSTRTQGNGYNRVGDYIEYFRSNSPSRGVILGFSDNGDKDESQSIVDTVINSMSSIGVDRENRTYPMIHRKIGYATILPTTILCVMAYFGLTSWIVFGIAAVFSLGSMIGVPYFSTFWIQQSVKRGAAPIPPFFRYSLRRLTIEWWKKIMPFDFDGRQKWAKQNNMEVTTVKYTEKPSTPEVFPLYTTSAMQFLSMPLNGRGSTNVSKSVIPQVSMPSFVNNTIKNFIKSDDVSYVGISAKNNEPVFRTPKDLNFGIAVGGDANSGKTNLLQLMFIEDSRLSRKETGLFGKKKEDGSRQIVVNPIWFETKSDDLHELTSAVERFDPLVVSLHNPNNTRRLALEGKRFSDHGVTIDDIQQQVGLFTSAMEAIWGSSFMHRSKNIATQALMIAYLVDKSDLKCLGLLGRIDNPQRPNIIQLVSYLIGSYPQIDMEASLKKYHEALEVLLNDERKEKLLKKKLSHGGEDELMRLRVLSMSIGALLNMYSLRDAMGPLQSKIPILEKSFGLFSPVTKSGEQREEYSIDELFDYGGPVIVDMTTDGSTLNAVETRNFVMMVHYILWQRLRIRAGGWAAQGRYTRLYADEITNFTGRAADEAPCATLIGEVRDQGRSYGVSHTVGYQNFGQLPKDTRASVLGFTSGIFLRFINSEDQNEVINQVNSDRYTVNNVRSFPQGVGIALMTIQGNPVDPFTIKTPHSIRWNEALKNADESVMEAFDVIAPEEIEFMRHEKKKKVDDNNTDDDYQLYSEKDDVFGQSYNDVSNNNSDDDGIKMQWS